jgi:hypothetical protein
MLFDLLSMLFHLKMKVISSKNKSYLLVRNFSQPYYLTFSAGKIDSSAFSILLYFTILQQLKKQKGHSLKST